MSPSKSTATILQAALEISSRDGLEGITIGRLSKKLGISKSGVIGQFGTKENLQVELVKFAAAQFNSQVILPNSALEPGLSRLHGMLSCWQSYASGQTGLPGGCFFIAAAAEFDAKPGPVNDLIKHLGQSWLGAIEGELATAKSSGHLAADADPSQLAFEIHGLLLQANWSLQLLGDTAAGERLSTGLSRVLTPGTFFNSPIV